MMNLFDENGYGIKLHMPSPKSMYKAVARLTETNLCPNNKEFKIKITIPAYAVNSSLSKGNNLEVFVTLRRIVENGKIYIKSSYTTKTLDSCAYWQCVIDDYPEFIQEYLEDLYSCSVKYLEKNNCLKPYSHMLHVGRESILQSNLLKLGA